MTARRPVGLALFSGLLLAGVVIPGQLALASTATRAQPATQPTLRFVAGPNSARDAAGRTWAPDTSVVVGGQLSAVTRSIAGTDSPALFQTTRWGMSGYRVPVANGTYRVDINESENYWPTAGRRVFSVSAEGHPELSAIDIAKRVGVFHATTLSFTVPVTDGVLNLGFTASVDNAKVDSFSVTPVPAAVAAAPVATAPTSIPVATPGTSGTATTGPVRTPFDYGATGNGSSDDTAALQRAFDAAPAGGTVVLPAGKVFAHAGVLHLRVAGLHVAGPGTLLATNEASSSVWIEADRVVLDGGLVVRTAHTTQRWAAWEQMGLRLVGHTGAVLRNITVDGSAAAGIYVGGADHFTLDHVTVSNTRADGIHMTQGSSFGTLIDPTTVNTGDDGVAVVSYGADGAACHDITVTGAHVLGTTGGRGMSVVGGSRVTYTDVDIERSAAAGLYIAAEGSPWFSAAPTNVTVRGGRIVGANTDASIDHGAVVVLSGESTVAPSNIAVSDLAISGTRASASRDVGVITYGIAPTGVVLSRFAINGGPANAYQGNSPAGSYRTVGWTQNGRALPDHLG